jgi:HEPN domain-containing protein
MSMPANIDARRFYRVAFQRLEDGVLLLGLERPRAAVYLAGYAVECMLKSLLIAETPTSRRDDLMVSFRGASAHDIDWLRDMVVRIVGKLPVHVARDLSLVSSWSTDLRYEPGAGNLDDATSFLAAAKSILSWCDRRM